MYQVRKHNQIIAELPDRKSALLWVECMLHDVVNRSGNMFFTSEDIEFERAATYTLHLI